uniref:Uncharacterized protein n=1 Tax=Branchiostoma floridae TaxID=7739 RepID=C3ZMH8_BRAFL|eukprot:XP_002590262.1 hypothetical protein BRAFLDRAFT_109336 [Branchiostoma floridae]
MSEGNQQSQANTGGTTPQQQRQTDWRSLADATANIPNPLYVSRADATYDTDANNKKQCRSLLKKLLHTAEFVFCLVVAIMLPYLSERLTSSGRNCSYLHKLIWKSLLDLGTNLEAWDQLALLEKKGPRGRLDRQEKRGPRSRLDRLEKREPWGRLVLCLSDLLDLQEKKEPWDRLVLCLSGLLDFQEKREPWGRLVLQEKRDRLALCLLGHPDLQGRLVCRETRFALDQLDEVRH